MAHDPSKVPTADQVKAKLHGGSKHGRTDYMTMFSMADCAVLLDELLRLSDMEVKHSLENARLRAQVDGYTEWRDRIQKSLDDQDAENAKLRAALEWYADPDNYVEPIPKDSTLAFRSRMAFQLVKRARAALGRTT